MPVCELSICIPTFNRAEFLDLLLRSIQDQLANLPCVVEIIVLDNASTDATQCVLRKWSLILKNYLTVIYHKANIGGNLNIAEAAGSGFGRYVWVLGDDEILPEGALSKIVRYLRADLDYIYLNHAVFDRSMSRVKIPRWNSLSQDLYIRGRQDTMRALGPSPTFISAVIARRGILNSLSAEEVCRYASYGFNQLYAFYHGLPKDVTGVATAENLLHARGDNSGSAYDWNRYFVTGLGFVFDELRRKCGYKREVVSKALSAVVFRYHLPRVLNESAEGRDSSQLRRLAFPYFRGSSVYWCILLPASIIPSAFMRSIKRIRRLLAGQRLNLISR
jgi:abequosyltransferase